jgi:hypothetical protein
MLTVETQVVIVVDWGGELGWFSLEPQGEQNYL